MTAEPNLKMENQDNANCNDKNGIASINSNSRKAESMGEELYLIHLRRAARTERQSDDYDYEKPRKHGRIGEELWEVHLKRSRGIPSDDDIDREKNLTASVNHEEISRENNRTEVKETMEEEGDL